MKTSACHGRRRKREREREANKRNDVEVGKKKNTFFSFRRILSFSLCAFVAVSRIRKRNASPNPSFSIPPNRLRIKHALFKRRRGGQSPAGGCVLVVALAEQETDAFAVGVALAALVVDVAVAVIVPGPSRRHQRSLVGPAVPERRGGRLRDARGRGVDRRGARVSFFWKTGKRENGKIGQC